MRANRLAFCALFYLLGKAERSDVERYGEVSFGLYFDWCFSPSFWIVVGQIH